MKKTIFVLLLALSAAGPPAAAEVLYNGIVLPDVWPPRYAEPDTLGPMPVPYLVNKPEVIPVNIGRQLFVDNFLIAHTDLQPVYHTPDFYPGNPVLEPTADWENTAEGGRYAAPFSDGVWFDETDGKFKMWYLAGAGSIHKTDGQHLYTGYAESADGKVWTKPEVGLLPGTCIVDTASRDASSLWLDKRESDPTRRFKRFNMERNPLDRQWQMILKYSPDGVNWSSGVAQSGGLNARNTVMYNPFRNVWCLSMRADTELSSRSRRYAEAKTPEALVTLAHRVRTDVPDENIVYWFTPDDQEPRHPEYPDIVPGIYNFDTMPYESIVLGQYAVWQGPENDVCKQRNIQKRNEVCLGYSRDGFHFSRPSHKAFLANNPTEGAWNWGNMQSAMGSPVIVGDSLYFYCSGRRINDVMWDSYSSTGLAMLRRDGFVSMHAGAEKGTLTTEALAFDGEYLFVNVDLATKKGELKVEVLDKNGEPIADFAGKNVVPLKKINSTKAHVVWKDAETLAKLRNKAVRLRFTLTDGDLYSFWISPWPTGESRGYTAGGGPGLHPSGQDLKTSDL